MKQLYAITLNWNRKADTLACLDSFQAVRWPAGWAVQTLLVDNGSSDDTVAAVRARFPQVEVLQNERNLGFAGGANRGMRHALHRGADAIFLVNNDTFFDPALGEALLAAMDEGVAAVSPAIFYAEPPEAIWSLGGGRNPWTLESTGDHGRTLAPLPDAPFDREVLTGCAILFQRAALESVGLLDEQFFMYYEDMDWSLRATRAGWRLRVAPAARLWHKEAQSSGGLGSPAERYHMGLASVQYFRKNARGAQWLLIVPIRIGSALKLTVRLAQRRRFTSIVSYWRGLWHGLCASVRREGVNVAP